MRYALLLIALLLCSQSSAQVITNPYRFGEQCFEPTISGTTVKLQPGDTYQDASKLTPADDAGESVYTWENSGSGSDFVQATSGDRCVIADDVENGYDGCDFTPSDYMHLSPTPFTHTEHNANNDFFVGVVFQVDDLTAARFVAYVGDNATNVYIDGHIETTGDLRAVDRSGSTLFAESNNSASTGTTYWGLWKWNGEDDRSVRLQGDTWVQTTTLNTDHVNAWDWIVLGARGNSATPDLGFDGKILEVWMIEASVSSGDESDLTSYFECKFGL